MPSFKKEFISKYYESIKRELDHYLSTNAQQIGFKHYKRLDFKHLQLNDYKIRRINIDDIADFQLYLILEIDMKWTVTTNKGIVFNHVECALLHGDFTLTCEDFQLENLSYIPHRKFKMRRPLDDQLIPVIGKADYDSLAEDILEELYPEFIGGIAPLDAQNLSDRLGLTINFARLSKDGSIRAQIYFSDTMASVYHGEGLECLFPVRAGTILVDSKLKSDYGEEAYNNAIIHECLHWILHQKFATLTKLTLAKLEESSCQVLADPNNFMEKQARGLSPRLLMPKKLVLKKLSLYEEDYSKFKIKNIHPRQYEINKVKYLIQRLKADFTVSTLAAKLRLIELGYDAARGVYNFVDGVYIRDYAFSPGALSDKEIYSINKRDFALLFIKSQEFRSLILSNNYLYLDSHLVKNDELYVENMALTDYARLHMDEACLKFQVNVKDDRQIVIDSHALQYADLNYTLDYDGDNLKSSLTKLRCLMTSLPNNLPGAITQVIKESGLTLEEVQLDCDISEKTLRNLRNRDDIRPTEETMVQFCIGMSLPPQISHHLMELAGYRANSSEQSLVYQSLLYGHGGMGLDYCNELLVDLGYKPLGRTAKEIYDL